MDPDTWQRAVELARKAFREIKEYHQRQIPHSEPRYWNWAGLRELTPAERQALKHNNH